MGIGRMYGADTHPQTKLEVCRMLSTLRSDLRNRQANEQIVQHHHVKSVDEIIASVDMLDARALDWEAKAKSVAADLEALRLRCVSCDEELAGAASREETLKLEIDGFRAQPSEPVAWHAFCDRSGGQMVHAIKGRLIEDADTLYGKNQWTLAALYASPPAPAAKPTP